VFIAVELLAMVYYQRKAENFLNPEDAVLSGFLLALLLVG
jgi:hypothetical protein